MYIYIYIYTYTYIRIIVRCLIPWRSQLHWWPKPRAGRAGREGREGGRAGREGGQGGREGRAGSRRQASDHVQSLLSFSVVLLLLSWAWFWTAQWFIWRTAYYHYYKS